MTTTVPECPLSELDAVNQMLDAIGEDIATSIDEGTPDSLKAQRELNRIKLEVLTPGWACNTETLKLGPDTDGWITVGADVIAVTMAGTSKRYRITIRTDPNDSRRKLYNLGSQSFVFNGVIYATVIRNLDFADLELPLKMYVAARATRTFQESTMGADSLDKFIVRRESEAYAKLIDAEAEEEQSNLLTSNRQIAGARYHYRDPTTLLY